MRRLSFASVGRTVTIVASLAALTLSSAQARPVGIFEDDLDLSNDFCAQCITPRVRLMAAETSPGFELPIAERVNIVVASRILRSDRGFVFNQDVSYFLVASEARETPVTAPAPAAIGLLLTGLAGLGLLRRRQSQA